MVLLDFILLAVYVFLSFLLLGIAFSTGFPYIPEDENKKKNPILEDTDLLDDFNGWKR